MREGPRLRSAKWAVLGCLAAAALALGLSACGGGSSAMAGPTGTAGAATATGTKGESAQAGATGKTTPSGSRSTASTGACASQLGELLDAMATLRTNLVAGLSYEQYVGELEAIRGAYHGIPSDEIALGCLKAAGTPAEKTLNKYIEASNYWTACVEETGCEAVTIESTLQTEWRQASKLLSGAQQGLQRLEKQPSSS
ncbi:MAG: hypothetical protein H0X42_08185 [Solirubrobacterales bacterium]|nr:hypothetical protein [Solirubrobacterales bacterium]